MMMAKHWGRVVLLAMTVAVVPGTAPLAAEDAPLVLNTGTREPYTTGDKKGFLDVLIAEVFRRIGERAEVEVYDASQRAMIQADAGIDAGFAMRVKGLEAKFPNMVMVPEKVIDNDFVAMSKGPAFPTPDWSALDGHDVAYILGWKIFEAHIVGHESLVLPKDADQLIGLLRNGRVDVILYERWQGAWRAKNTGLAAVVHEPPLASVPMYMYLHKKHAALVDKAAQALREMKSDGTYAKIVADTLAEAVR